MSPSFRIHVKRRHLIYSPLLRLFDSPRRSGGLILELERPRLGPLQPLLFFLLLILLFPLPLTTLVCVLRIYSSVFSSTSSFKRPPTPARLVLLVVAAVSILTRVYGSGGISELLSPPFLFVSPHYLSAIPSGMFPQTSSVSFKRITSPTLF